MAMLDAALSLAARGFPIFPLHSPNGHGGCSCGGVDGCSPAKHPRTLHGVDDATVDMERVRSWFQTWPDANVAIATGEETFVLDIDGPDGEDALAGLVDRYGALPDTLQSLTARGRHIYFKGDKRLRNTSSRLGKHVDTRGVGGYVVAPPSIHASGAVYRFINDFELAPLPACLLPLPLSPHPVTPPTPLTTAPRPDLTARLRRAEALIRKHPPAISGAGGHDTLFRLVLGLIRGLEIPEDEAFNLIVSDYNHRCEPPWSDREIVHKIEDAQSNSSLAWGYLIDERPPLERRPEIPPAAAGVPSTPAPAPPAPVYDVPGILSRSTSGGPRYATGLAALDELLRPKADPTRCGLQTGRIVALAGAPGAGKSLLADQLAFALARHGFRVVLLVDDEPREDAAERIGQSLGFRHAELNPEYPATLAAVKESLTTRAIDIQILPDEEQDGPRPTIETAIAMLQSRPSELGHVLIVDSLHSSTSAAERESDPPRIQIQTRMAVLKSFRRAGGLVILTTEAARAAYAAKDPGDRTNPLASGAESRAIEYGADLLLFLTTIGDSVRVDVPKNRIGRQRGAFTARINAGAARFESVDEDTVAAETNEAETARLTPIEGAIVALIEENGDAMTGRQIEAEHIAGCPDVRAAMKSAVAKGKLTKTKNRGRGGGFVYLPKEAQH